ncbi:Related to UV-damaged DNA-binding protein, partial [Nocardioides sp. PD653]
TPPPPAPRTGTTGSTGCTTGPRSPAAGAASSASTDTRSFASGCPATVRRARGPGPPGLKHHSGWCPGT